MDDTLLQRIIHNPNIEYEDILAVLLFAARLSHVKSIYKMQRHEISC
ncbi:MAG: hypothetical protein QNJ63_11235 [Calothrix sp. MO_192.B10]|nr:hypothetical protein [Calothrix sp. MO_192.B10]